jgi:hypothetical protein
LPTLSPYGPKTRYIDVSGTGPKSFTYAAASTASWITLKNANGTVRPTDAVHRVEVGIDWSKFPAGSSGVQNGVVKIKASGGESVDVNVRAIRTAAAGGFKGHVEGDGVVVSFTLLLWDAGSGETYPCANSRSKRNIGRAQPLQATRPLVFSLTLAHVHTQE